MAKKNVLLFFCDQLRADIFDERHKFLQIPNLRKLYNESMVYVNTYSPSPVCVPARHAMYYGLNVATSNVNDNNSPFDCSSAKNIMQRLQDEGYYCKGIGKMHFTGKGTDLHGFNSRDRQEELPRSIEEDEYMQYLQENGFDYVFDAFGERSEMYYVPQISQLPEKAHPTNWIGDRSVKFIEEYNSDKPFYLMTSFVHPHPPFAVPTPWNKLYRADKDLIDAYVPENYEDWWVYINRFQNRYKYKDYGYDQNVLRTMRYYYYACVSFIDYQVGRVIKALKDKGLYDDTMILFTADHGEMLGDYNCVGKRCMLEPSCRIPLLIKDFHSAHAGVYKNTVSLIDVMPTVLENAAGQTGEFEGINVIQAALSNENNERLVHSQFNEKGNGLYMIVSETDKFIYSAPDDREQYFLKENGRESADFIHEAKYADRIAYLRSKMQEHLRAHNSAAVDANGFVKYPRKTVPDDKRKGLLRQDQGYCAEKESQIAEGYTVDRGDNGIHF